MPSEVSRPIYALCANGTCTVVHYGDNFVGADGNPRDGNFLETATDEQRALAGVVAVAPVPAAPPGSSNHITQPDPVLVDGVPTWTVEVREDPAPVSVTRAQFFQQLAAQNIITKGDAVRAMAGAVPRAIEAAIARLDMNTQFSVTMRVAGATDFRIDDDVVITICVAIGITNAAIPAFWRAASLL